LRIPIKYACWQGVVLRACLVAERWSYLDIQSDSVSVHMGWGFWARFARSNVERVAPAPRVFLTAGAHGWSGRWLVNGAESPIASIFLREPARAFVLGFPVTLRELRVSVDDVDGLRAALA
jgi:hypothetical protein